MRRAIAVSLSLAVSACSGVSRGFTPDSNVQAANLTPAAKYTVNVENHTGATLHQRIDYRYCVTVTPSTADVPAHGSLPVTVAIHRSKCGVSGAFIASYRQDGAAKTTFGTLAFDYTAPNKRLPNGAARFNGRAYDGLCGEYRASSFKLFEGKPPSPGCYALPQLDVAPRVSRSFTLTIENASGVTLQGLAKSSYCMDGTPGGTLPPGATPYKVTTFGRSAFCDASADFTVYYWVPGAPTTDVVAVNWLWEAPSSIRIYPGGYHGFCAAKVAEAHVRITKC